MAKVELRGLTKTYPGGVVALAGLDLDIGDGETLVVVGPSGSGKSTLLRVVAGLERPEAGDVRIGGRSALSVPAHRRDLAMVFQDQGPYPHLSVFENLAFCLRARRLPAGEVRSRVEEVARQLGLSELLDRRPEALSGGQRRRVVLGRALARRPALLLLDEPLSGLDAPLRTSLRSDLIGLRRRLGTTTIHVTHDQAEALALGDRLAVLDSGRLSQVGTPQEVYDRPASRSVARFLGSPPMNLLPCEVNEAGGEARARIVGLDPEVSWAWTGKSTSRVDLGLRPEHIKMGELIDPNRFVTLAATLARLEPTGHEVVATFAAGPHELAVRLAPDDTKVVGQTSMISLDLSRAIWFGA